jgi:hypothetical protein
MTFTREAAIADQVEAAAYADLFQAAPAELKTGLGIRVERIAGMTLLIAPGVPATVFNRVVGLGLEQAAREADIEALIAAYQQAGIRTWWLHWNPVAQPAQFPQKLLALGFKEASRRAWAKVLRGTNPPPRIPTDLTIERAQACNVDAAMAAVVQAFGMPPVMAQWLAALQGRPKWKVYAVADQGRPVGGACLFVDGDRAWLGIAAIAASHRRRGGQGA